MGSAKLTGMNHRCCTRLAWLAALAVPLLIFYGPGLLPGRTQIPLDALHARVAPWRQHPVAVPLPVNNPVITDQVLQFEPWAEFMRQEFAAGRLPLWNPYVGGGVPLAANPQAGVFYPLSSPLAIAAPDRCPALRSWLHAVVAALFTALFLRRVGLARFAAVCGGLLFALSQFMVVWSGYPLGWAMAWLPAWIYFAERFATEPPPGRCVLPAAVVVALTALAGHPETLFHLAVFSTLYCAARSIAAQGLLGSWRGPLRLFGAGILGAGLAAVLLAPFFEYLLASDAWQLRAGLGGGTALPPSLLLGGLFPGLFGHPADNWVHVNFNERAFSVGVIATLAAAGTLLHREAWRGPWPLLTVLGLSGAALSFDRGGHLGFLSGLPGFSAAANHRLLALGVFAVVGLAAVGLDRTARHGLGRRWIAPAVVFYAVAAFLLFGPISLQVGPLRHVPPAHVRVAASLGLAAIFAAVVTAAILRRRPRATAVVLAALAVLELGLWGFGVNTVTPAAWRNRSTPEIAALQARDPVRLVGFNGAFLPESNVPFQLPCLDGYDALGVHAFSRMLGPLLPPDPTRLADPRLQLVGVTHAYADQPLAAVPNGWHHEACGDGHLYQRAQPLGRVFLCGRVDVCVDEDAVETRLASPAFDPGSGTLLVAGSAPSPSPDRDLGPSDRAVVAAARPGELVVDVELEGPAVLVVRDAYFPGWHARIGTQEAEIIPAFGGLRGVALPTGHHRVVFAYEPLALRLGAIVSGVTLVVLVLLSLRRFIRRRREARHGLS